MRPGIGGILGNSLLPIGIVYGVSAQNGLSRAEKAIHENVIDHAAEKKLRRAMLAAEDQKLEGAANALLLRNEDHAAALRALTEEGHTAAADAGNEKPKPHPKRRGKKDGVKIEVPFPIRPG
jgi:hypothetical protein